MNRRNHIAHYALLFIIGTSLNTTCFATPATEKSVNQLIQLSELSSVLDQSAVEMQPFFDQKAEDLIRKVTSTDVLNIDEQNAALQISALLSDLHRETIRNPKFMQMFRDIFKKTYTEEELQAYITFLSTPIGQSINKKSHQIMTEIYTQTSQLSEQALTTPESQKAFQEKLTAILTPLVAE